MKPEDDVGSERIISVRRVLFSSFLSTRKSLSASPYNYFMTFLVLWRKGGDVKKVKRNSSGREQSLGISQPADTVYRILCPSRKIGGVIGKGGGIIKTLREKTKAKITVADSIPGSDERIIIIYSSPTKNSRKQNSDEGSAAETEKDSMEPHCAAQDALLKVHDRIIEEDLFGGIAPEHDNENNNVTPRLLVPNNMVGCLLGKRGDVIQRLRCETRDDNLGPILGTGANIRILPVDCLRACAMDTDELVQVALDEILAQGGKLTRYGDLARPAEEVGREIFACMVMMAPKDWGKLLWAILHCLTIPNVCNCVKYLTAAPSILHSYMTSSGPNVNAQQTPYQSMNSLQSPYQNEQPSPYQNVSARQSLHGNTNSHGINALQSPHQNINSNSSPYSIDA
ncbi:uncharacterized protein LOC123226344 [Mangifera indica]|uniref:uncharacterized protein LOC123226344 n=1 Tax=Mangifera indica TaxID=29780 RepID=UPI001CFABF8C|nr:uncharacterized protein LOC123226344 [Mangifera indica]